MATGVRRSRMALMALLLPAMVSCRAVTEGGSIFSTMPSPARTSASPIAVDPTPQPTPVLPTLAGWQVKKLAIDGYASSVAESDRGWVAVGVGVGPGDPAIWYSADGEEWTPVEDLPGHLGSLQEVMVGGPGFIVMGTTADIDFGAPYVWTSPDGRAWTASDLNATPLTDGVLTGISIISGNLLAAGGRSGEGGPDHGPALMWRSTDGNHWGETTLDSGVVDGVHAEPPVVFGGRFVSVGSGYHPPIGRVWFSSDGIDWQLQRDDPAWVDAHLLDSAVVNGRLVVVGGIWLNESYDSRPAIWTSADAVSWSSAYVGPCCGSINKVVATVDGGIAIQDTIVYQSADGLGWRLAGTVGGFHGQIYDAIETLRYGQVLSGWSPEGFVLLIPPRAMSR